MLPPVLQLLQGTSRTNGHILRCHLLCAVSAFVLLDGSHTSAVYSLALQETDPLVNAMPITCWERAKQRAKQLMEQGYPDNPPRGYLYGGCMQ